MNTFHEYTAPVSKALYEEYGQLDASLLKQHIKSMGLHVKDGFRGNDEQVYHYMVVVMAPEPVDTLHELFPGITTEWTHHLRSYDLPRAWQSLQMGFKTGMVNGKLYADTEDATFRI